MVSTGTISLSTKGFTDVLNITDKVTTIVAMSGIQNGLVNVFCSGYTGSITTIEFESGVINDLKRAIEKIVPSKIPYEHNKRWMRRQRLFSCEGCSDETFPDSSRSKGDACFRDVAIDSLHGF
jgi:thiamine phosphate synthase YjbQ (UPF0047 family)